MGTHRILHQMYEAAYANYIAAAAQTITCTQWGEVFEVTTDGTSDTLTLAQPTKPGMLCAVVLNVDGGDLTLTVTGGYNADADTSITFADAGDTVVFYSIHVGSSFYWRVLAQEGTNIAVETLEMDTATIDTLSRPAVEADEHGAGAVGTGGFCRTYRYVRDGSIITDIEVDLTGLDSSGTANDVIGLATGGAAYIGRNVVATNGVIYKVEVTCVEVPLTGDADILFVAGSAADEAFDDTVANTQTIADGTGDWTLGETIVLTAPAAIAANYYYYMTQGASDDATYTAGQFLLRFYGKAVMSA